MTSWSLFSALADVLVQYYTGSELVLYAGIMILFFLGLLMAGMEFRYTVIFILPLAAALAGAGVFGPNTWVFNVLLLVVAFIYGYALLKFYT